MVVDRLAIRQGIEGRLADSIETASKLSGGLTVVDNGKEDMIFSENYACPDHNFSMPDLTPRLFSFNNPFGACPTCSGLGMFMKINPELIVPDKTKSLAEGCIKGSGWSLVGWNGKGNTIAYMYFAGLAEHYGFTMDTPFNRISEKGQNAILYGTSGEEITFHR